MTTRPKWKVDTTSMPGVIRCVMAGVVDVDEMKDFVAAHNRAVDEMRGADYKV